jgi:hypothetical protein
VSLFRPRSPAEAEWWANATARERLAFFLGVQRGMGYAWPGPGALRQLKVRFGLAKAPVQRAAPPAAAQHDETAPCAVNGCDNAVGPYAGSGRRPTRCELHRNHGSSTLRTSERGLPTPATIPCPVEGCDVLAATPQGAAAHARKHETVECGYCGRVVGRPGIGPHMAACRRLAAERRQDGAA